jgi:hypothetical protein
VGAGRFDEIGRRDGPARGTVGDRAVPAAGGDDAVGLELAVGACPGAAGDSEVVGQLADRREAVPRSQAAGDHERGDLLTQPLVGGNRRARVDLEDHA